GVVRVRAMGGAEQDAFGSGGRVEGAAEHTHRPAASAGRLIPDCDRTGRGERTALDGHCAVGIGRAEADCGCAGRSSGDYEAGVEVWSPCAVSADVYVADGQRAAVDAQRPAEIRVRAETTQGGGAAVNHERA